MSKQNTYNMWTIYTTQVSDRDIQKQKKQEINHVTYLEV